MYNVYLITLIEALYINCCCYIVLDNGGHTWYVNRIPYRAYFSRDLYFTNFMVMEAICEK